MTVDGGVGLGGVEMRRFEHHHLAPGGQLARRHVRPGLAVVLRHVDVTVVGADPEERRADGGWRDRVDDAEALRLRRRVGGGRCVEVRRHARVFARHVIADPRPVTAAVRRLEQILIAEIQRVRVRWRKHDRQRPGVPRRRRQVDLRRNAVDSAGLRVAFLHCAAVDDVGVQRIRRGVAALAAGAQRLPVAHRDGGEPAAAADADGSAVLLRARYPVRKRVIHRKSVDLCGWLVDPRAPRRMLVQSVNANHGALIASENHPAPVVRVDPELVIIVAAGRSLERLAEGPPAVPRSVYAGVRHVDEVRILRVHDDFAEIPAAAPDAGVG